MIYAEEGRNGGVVGGKNLPDRWNTDKSCDVQYWTCYMQYAGSASLHKLNWLQVKENLWEKKEIEYKQQFYNLIGQMY